MPVRSRSELEAELLQLIESFSVAYQLEDLPAAARYIDRAWRLSPANPEINYLYGRLHLAAGTLAEAARFLEAALASRPNGDYAAAYLLAVCRGGQIELALDELHQSLRSFSCEPDSALADAATEICLSAASQSTGWIGAAADLTLHGKIRNNDDLIRVELSPTLSPSRSQTITGDRTEPFTMFKAGSVTTLPSGRVIARANGIPLVGGDLTVPLDFGLDGRATVNAGAIEGWVTFAWDPERSPELILQDEHGYRLRVPSTPDPLQPGHHVFTIAVSTCRSLGNRLAISAVLPDGRLGALPDTPLLVEVPPPLGAIDRQAGDHDVMVESGMNDIIDIVIPVCGGLHETRDCIQSVLQTTGSRSQIIVVDDGSPDPELTSQLDTLKENGRITLIRNPVPLGLPESINRGLQLHPDRDVVVLTADIEPFGDWLGRLRAAAYSAHNIATVGPLQRSKGLEHGKLSQMPFDTHEYAAHRDRVAASLNAGKTIVTENIDSACLYIRRDSLDALGYFDSQTFAGGYGEDVDLGRRAALSGRENILATDIYIRYIGRRRPEAMHNASVDRNTRLLELRYPGISGLNPDRAIADPTFEVRRQLDEECLVAANRRHALFVSLALGGGVERAVADRIALARSQSIGAVVLRPVLTDANSCWLEVDAPGFADLRYDMTVDMSRLLSFLRRLKFERVELHHFLGLCPDLIEGILAFDCPVDVKIHDYIWYCPRVNLLNELSRYCGEPKTAACERCIARNGSYLGDGLSVAELRTRSTRWLARANSITVPIASVAVRYRAQFPRMQFAIDAPETDLTPTPIPVARRQRLKVVLIGALGDHKGLSILTGMARFAAERDLPLEFVVIGFTRDDNALLATGRVFITGEYREPEIAGLIAREQPDVALFLSQFPETWCYALTHALRAKVPVAALNIGAIAERLSNAAMAPVLFPTASSPAEICDGLLSIFNVENPIDERGDLSNGPEAD